MKGDQFHALFVRWHSLCHLPWDGLRSIHHKTVYGLFIIRQSAIHHMKVSSIHQVIASLCSFHHMTIHIPFITWQSTFHSPYDSPHSIHHITVDIPFIIKLGQFPLHSSYGSLHSILHMTVSTVSTLFIIWWSLPYSSHDCFIHHMPVSTLFITWQSAPFIIIMTVLHPTNHFSTYHLVNRAALTSIWYVYE